MRLALIAAALLIVAACGGSAGPGASVAPSAARATATPAPVKLTISYSNPIADFLPFWIAADDGTFAKNGIDPDIQSIASAQGVAALLAGQTQVAGIGGSEILSAAAGGADLVVVANLVPVYPHIFYVAPDIRTPADLKGKKVGISSIGSSSDIATRVLLRRIGLDADKDVTIVAVGSTDQRTAALVAGAIQGAVTLVPDTLVVEDKGFKPLYDLAALNLPASQTVIAVQRSLLTSKREVVQRFVDSVVTATARIRKDRSFSIATLKKWLKSTDDRAMTATYEKYAVPIIPTLPYPKAEQFKDSQETLGAKNDKVKTFDLSKLLDPSFVQSAADRGLDKQ
ncbi:MAG: ABC transporter substrate-binding protein [Actinobacteria bacterium]|nr:MAG: ABC transporter substrate-binding protein [Actinomycetota bacterium]